LPSPAGQSRRLHARTIDLQLLRIVALRRLRPAGTPASARHAVSSGAATAAWPRQLRVATPCSQPLPQPLPVHLRRQTSSVRMKAAPRFPLRHRERLSTFSTLTCGCSWTNPIHLLPPTQSPPAARRTHTKAVRVGDLQRCEQVTLHRRQPPASCPASSSAEWPNRRRESPSTSCG
jgi:hypothetical protein